MFWRIRIRRGLSSAFLLLPACLALASCAPDPWAIPGPARSVTRSDAIAIAHTYSRLTWMPEERHVRHGTDRRGILVHTPDLGLARHGRTNGWWQPGVAATGMPYQWGGFDTPRGFLDALARGEAAGDIQTPEKRRLDDAATSAEACGIDCSGFVSRCWRLRTAHSTRKLPGICDRLESWSDLRPGDILLKTGHVLLFNGWTNGGREVLAYEAGPFPVWRVNAAAISMKKLRAEGYRPWRYRRMRDG